MEEMSSPKKSKTEKPKPAEKSKWGPVLIQKPNTRGNGKISIMEKAAAYKMRKNLEIPPSFKGNSFAVLNPDILVSQASKMDIAIGNDKTECMQIVDNIVENEKNEMLIFC